MKYLIIILMISILTVGLLFCSPPSPAAQSFAKVIHDTVPVMIIRDTCAVRTDTVYIYRDSKKQLDSCKAVIKALRKRLFVADDKVNTATYYLRIAIKHPSQKQFLPSWLSRAVAD